jgi:hypothetical protein
MSEVKLLCNLLTPGHVPDGTPVSRGSRRGPAPIPSQCAPDAFLILSRTRPFHLHMASSAQRRACFQLCDRPVSAGQIASATRLVGEIFGEPIAEADASSRVTLAVHEVLERGARS